VYFTDDAGDLKLIPASWTDVEPPDAFVAQAAGRAHVRPADLLALVDLVAGLQQSESK